MSVEEDARILADSIWSYWKQLGVTKPKMTWIELYQLCRYYLEECKKRTIDPQEYSLRDEVDAMISFEENKAHVKELLMVKPSPDELLEEELARLTSGTEFKVLREKDYDKLLQYERMVSQLERRIKEEKTRREAEKAQLEAEIKRLKEELEKAKPVKIKLLQDVPPWLKAGQIIESHDFPWVLKLIEEGKAVRVEEGVKPLVEAVREVIGELRRLAGEV